MRRFPCQAGRPLRYDACTSQSNRWLYHHRPDRKPSSWHEGRATSHRRRAPSLRTRKRARAQAHPLAKPSSRQVEGILLGARFPSRAPYRLLVSPTCSATPTAALDVEAYELLQRANKRDESFSTAVERRRPPPERNPHRGNRSMCRMSRVCPPQFVPCPRRAGTGGHSAACPEQGF